LEESTRVSSPINEDKIARLGKPPESAISIWRKLLVCVALGSFVLISVDRTNAISSFWSRSIKVDFTHAELSAPGVYKLQLRAPVDHKRMFSSKIRLLDADQDKFSYTPRADSFFAKYQGLFTIQEKRILLIAWPTSQMALLAKGEGILIFPLLLTPLIIDVAFFLLCGSCAALFCCLPFPTGKVEVLAKRSATLAARSLRMLGRHPIIAFSLPSAYLLSVYPPLWKDADALGQLISPASTTNIYHFPALFCFSARLIVWLGDLLLTWKSPDLLGLQKPTLQGIYTLVVAQHLALVLSLSLLCKTLTKRDGLRGVFVIGFSFLSSLYASLLLCGSEAWSICATISLFAFGLRIYFAEGNESMNWIGYGFSLIFAIGSRHINVLLGFWLFGLYFTVSIIRLLIGEKNELPARPLLKAGISLIALWVAVSSNNFLELYLANRVGVEPRTTLGRTLSDRVDSFLMELRPAERAKLAQALSAMTSDRNVRMAVQDQATIGSFYKGTSSILEEQLRAAGFNGEHLQAEKDRVVLQATFLYLKTLHPVLMRVIWKDFIRGFTKTGNSSLAITPFAENSYVGKYRLNDPDIWTPLDVLPSTFLPESVAWLDRSVSDVYLTGINLMGFRRVHLNLILLLTFLSLGLCFWYRRCLFSRTIPALSILLAGIGVFGATMVCVYFMTRYVLPLWISVLIAFALAIDGLFDGIIPLKCLESKVRKPFCCSRKRPGDNDFQ
jgi:hypothetical protein